MHWIPIILLVCLLFQNGDCSPVRCSDHYLYLHLNDNVHEEVCWNEGIMLTISPSLPKGIIFDNGIISGTPLKESPLTQYQVYNDTVVGSFWLSISKSISYVSVGFSSRVVYIGSPIPPIRIFSDGPLTNCTLWPSLSNGLQIDVAKRIIHGLYTGSPANITYILSVQTTYATKAISFTLSFIHPQTTMHFITQCEYSYEYLVHQPIEWYERSAPLQCSFITSVTTSSSSLEQSATRSIGYLAISSEEEYMFSVRCLGGLVMRIDNQTLFYVSPIEQTNRWNQTATFFLSRGLHFLEILHARFSTAGSLELLYKTPSMDWSVVDQHILVAGGISPFNYDTQSIVTYINHPIETTLPSVNGCACEQHIIFPSLPNPLKLDPSTGVISGTPTSTSYDSYTMTCVSQFGNAMHTIIISLAYFPQPGLQVTYYYYENTFALSLLETAIDHPLVDPGVPWPSLPLRLFRGFTAQWEGLVYPKQDGVHLLRFVLSGGIRVWVENRLVIDHWENVTPEVIYEVPLSFQKKRLYSLRIMYLCQGFESGIRFYMKHPESSHYIIPGDGFLYSEITEEFRYTLNEMIGVVNTTISSNSPLFNYHTAASFVYDISPSLPKGLELSSGIISGVPLEVMESTVFTIRALSTKIMLTATVVIEIQHYEVPSNLFMYDLLGHHLTSYSVYKYSYVTPLLLASSVSNVLWRVHPTLPEGFVLDNRSYRIAGRALTIHPNTTFTFFAQSTGGVASFEFPIEVKGCEHGRFWYTSFSEHSSGEFHLTGKGQQVDEKIVTGDYGTVLCLPVQVYTIRILCTSNTPCSFRLIREGELVMLRRQILPSSWDEFTFDYTNTNPPVIHCLRPIIVTRVNMPFVALFQVTNAFYAITFSPPLPSAITFDQTTLKLSGTIQSPSIIQFTVVAQNDYGRDELGISIYVDACPSGSALYQFSRKNSESTESFSLILKGKRVYSTFFTGEAFNEFICLSSTTYSIEMESEDDRGWVPGSDLVIQDDLGRLYTTFILDAGKKIVTDSLNLTKIVQETTPMRYLISVMAPSSDWKALSFHDESWKTGASPHWETVPSSLATVYFRRTFITLKGSLAIHLFFRDGCVVYLNGVEVDRFNLPEGVIYHSTSASSRFSKALWMTVYSSYFETSQEVVIAVEVHRYYVIAATSIDFDLAVTQNQSPQLLLSINGTGTPSLLFAGTRHLAWSRSTPATTSFSFNLHRRYPVNRVDFVVGPAFQWNAPYSISVWGDQEIIAEVTSRSLFRRPFGVYSLHLPFARSHNTYSMKVESSLNGESVELRAIALYHSVEIYCSKDGTWPITPKGTTSQGVCHAMFGKSKRVCDRDGLEGVWGPISTAECVMTVPPFGMVYFDTSLRIANVTEIIWEQTVQSVVEGILKGSIESKVTFLQFGDCSTEDNLMIEVGVRVEVRRKYKSRMYQHLWNLHPSIQSELNKQGLTMISTRFHMGISTRDSYIILMAILGVLLLLSVLVCVAIIIRRTIMKRRMN